MTTEKHGATWLNAVLDRHLDDAAKMAGALIELESHPGHRLLTGTAAAGRTGRQWADAEPVLARLWRDFDTYRRVLDVAGQVRDRRSRPGQQEYDELRRLLVEPSVELARHAVALHERGLTGAAERIESTTLNELADRMQADYRQVSALVVRCDELSSGALARLVPLTGQVHRARDEVTELGLAADEPDAVLLSELSAKVLELERTATTDPLALADRPPDGLLVILSGQARELRARLGRLYTLRAQWPEVRARLHASVAAMTERRTAAEQVRTRAAERVLGSLPPLPPDRRPALEATLRQLDSTAGWAARETGGTELRAAVTAAEEELESARALAEGLLDRREELRGRFGAYRARAVRLGRVEDPVLLELGERIETTLWRRPSDLAAATRDLAAFRHRLAGEDGADTGKGTA